MTPRNKKLLKAKADAYNEYYTKRNTVEWIFSKLKKDILKDKIIYCPCDSDKSEFVKYIQENKDVLKYKQLIYTWDNYNEHDNLFDYCDVVITNPPFTGIKKFVDYLMNKKKEFLIICPATIFKYDIIIKNNYGYTIPNEYRYYTLPDGHDEFISNTCIYGNIFDKTFEKRDHKTFDKLISNDKIEYTDDKHIMNINYVNNIPCDYIGELLLPITFFSTHDDIFNDIEIKEIYKQRFTINGNIKFIRLLCYKYK